MRYTQKRNGVNEIPLLNAVCGIDMPYWRIDRADDLHSYLSGDAADKLAAYEDTGFEPEQIAEYLNATDEYVRASEEGRLIVLPCKVGDTVYIPIEKCRADFHYCPFNGGYGTERCDGDKNCKAYVKERGFSISDYLYIGKTVFLTRAEAEAALKGEKEDV